MTKPKPPADHTLRLLTQIRDAVTATGERLDAAVARLDDRLDRLDDRLDRLEIAQTEMRTHLAQTEMRLATMLVQIAASNADLKASVIEAGARRQDHDTTELTRRVEALEKVVHAR